MEPPVMKNFNLQQNLNQQQQNLSLMQLNSINYDTTLQPECLSPALSTISSSSSSSTSCSTKMILPDLSDEELAQLSVRQLNLKLQGHDRKIVTALKQKRRTLKNRGYALNCRVRRLQNQIHLESENVMLREQVRNLTEAINHLQERLNYYEPCIQNISPASFTQLQQQNQQQIQQLPIVSTNDTNYHRSNTVY